MLKYPIKEIIVVVVFKVVVLMAGILTHVAR